VGAFDSIKVAFRKYFLSKELRKISRNRVICSIKDAKSIGLLFDASDEEDHKIVTEFVQYFKDNQKIVKSLGFVNFNRVPHYCFPKLSYDYFTKKDINWYSKPSGVKVNDFVNEEFDVMIDLCTKSCFSLTYITAISKAKFKVGKFDEGNKEYFDFMLNVASNISLRDYIRDLTHYLSIINNGDVNQPL
jgi:hypothetical protein